MLCTTCRDIFFGHFDQRTYTHHLHARDLEHAAFRKCHICRVLWNAISDEPRLSEQPEGSENPCPKPVSGYYIRRKSIGGESILELAFTVNKNGIDTGGKCITFCLQSMNGKIAKSMLPLPVINMFTLIKIPMAVLTPT